MVGREAEPSCTRKLARDISSGSLEGAKRWREVHDRSGEPVLLATPVGE
jgi:hypothetical protein